MRTQPGDSRREFNIDAARLHLTSATLHLSHSPPPQPEVNLECNCRHLPLVVPYPTTSLPYAWQKWFIPTMSSLSVFPHLNDTEFDQACHAMLHAFQTRADSCGEWQSVHVIKSITTTLLRIAKPFPSMQDASNSMAYQDDDEIEEIVELDPEVLCFTPTPCSLTVHYDMILSPTYRVPVLYISIHDPLHRYPPTLNTLYAHLVPEHFRSQTESVGIIGGITITVRMTDGENVLGLILFSQHHPVTDRPVFFIHPCRTAEVMEASVGESGCVTAEEYLMIWIGALGKSVGLKVPLCLARGLK